MVLAAAGGGVDVLWNVFERFYCCLFLPLLVFVCGVIIFSVMFSSVVTVSGLVFLESFVEFLF